MALEPYIIYHLNYGRNYAKPQKSSQLCINSNKKQRTGLADNVLVDLGKPSFKELVLFRKTRFQPT